MKARLIKPAKAMNPEFSDEDRKEAEEAGKEYDVPKVITRNPGHIQDHPDSWMNCIRGFMNSEPIAVPEDEECREKVREWLKNRPAQIKQLANKLKFSNPAGRAAREYHKAMREAYEVELNELDPDSFPLGGDDAEIPEKDDND
jgi:hypothetical protein